MIGLSVKDRSFSFISIFIFVSVLMPSFNRSIKGIVIRPDKIHLNTVIRPPAHSIARPTSEARLKEIQKILGDSSEVIGVFKDTHKACVHTSDGQTVIALLKRRAMTVDQMIVSLEMNKQDIDKSLNQLLQEKIIKKYTYNGEEYFQAI